MDAARTPPRWWEGWLAFWRTSALIVAAPWDAALHAFAQRAELLPRRMAALGLDPGALARVDPATWGDLTRFCAACESDERCEWDLSENPDDPAWKDYCPNRQRLVALAAKAEGKRA